MDREGVFVSPFNMEMILNACPALLAAWKRHPFILDLDADGNVIVKKAVGLLCR